MVNCLDLMKASNCDVMMILFGTILGKLDIITLGINIGTELGSLYVSFDGSNDGKLGVFFLGDSLGYIDGKVLGSD